MTDSPSSLAGSAAPAPATAAPPAVRCRGLVKRYRDVVAVAGVDFEVARGECFGLLGPNGAGKTTTVEILEGLTAPDEGEVELFGRRWGAGEDQALRARLGIQLQETRLPDKLTVREAVRLFRSFTARGRGVDETLALVELEPKAGARIEKLSGGQRQRLTLACSLVGDPDLLFLDEPTTGLDPQARLKLWALVEELLGEGGTVVLTTHYMEEAARLCDRVAILDLGKIIAHGTPDDLVAGLGGDQVVELELEPGADGAPEEDLAPVLAGLPGVRGTSRRGDAWVLAVGRVEESLPPLIHALEARGAALASLATHRATLEDVFVELTGRELRDD